MLLVQTNYVLRLIRTKKDTRRLSGVDKDASDRGHLALEKEGMDAEWNRHIGKLRQVALLLDNFSPHLCALGDSPPPLTIKSYFTRQMRPLPTNRWIKKLSRT